MLGAVDLRRLGEHRGAAVLDQHVGGDAERRIGGDAGIAVRAAALQREHDFRGGAGLALGARHDRQHRLDALNPLGDGLPGAAGRLDGHGLEVIALDQAVFFLHAVDLKHLAAEPDHDGGAEVGVGGVAPLGPAQHVEAFAVSGKPAAGAVHEGDRAVDAGIILEHARAVDLLGDELRDRGRAVHRREHADVVARAGAPARAHVALEGRAQLGGEHLVVLRVLADAVVAGEIMERHVMLVHPFARADAARGKADDLAELAHRRALADRLDRHLVAARDALACGGARGLRARRHRVDGDDDVVLRRKADDARRGHGLLTAPGRWPGRSGACG